MEIQMELLQMHTQRRVEWDVVDDDVDVVVVVVVVVVVLVRFGCNTVP
jgi:hypothetical protein